MNPALVFLHGWGQSGDIWRGQLEHFSRTRQVLAPNLPGHGGAGALPPAEWPANLEGRLPDGPMILVGWSLGGMLAVRIAYTRPHRLRGIVLVASTPRFCTAPGWAHGIPESELIKFSHSLRKDRDRTLSRYFHLMLQGEELTVARLRSLERRWKTEPPPADEALHAGLELLRSLDLRREIPTLELPVLLIHGCMDAVVPLQASRYLARHLPHASLRILPGGHIPHITRPDDFNQILEEWCSSL